jgi:hypothetical protein
MADNFATRITSFWDRLADRLSGVPADADGDGDRAPQRKGIAITVCILLSAMLWFTFTMQETYTVVLEMPTMVSNIPDDQALVTMPPQRARVQVQGEGFQLVQLYYNPPTIPIDARREQVNLEDAVPELGKNVRPLSVSPRSVELIKERRITRRLPVRFAGSITTPDTHGLVSPPRILPDSVQVSGARSIIERLLYWPTEPVQLENIRDSIVVRVPLSDTLSLLVDKNLQQVTVSARAVEFTEAVRQIDVTITGAPPGRQVVTLEPPSVEVRYRVPIDHYSASLVAPDFFATISYDDIRADTSGRLVPNLQTPAGLMIRDVQMSPRSLRYYTILP